MRSAGISDLEISVKATPLRTVVASQSWSRLVMILGVAVALLVGCLANAVVMLQTRATTRLPEFALKATLGATRGSLTVEVLGEVAGLVVSACLAAQVLAAVALKVIVAAAPATIPRLSEVSLDWRVSCVTLGASMAVLFGSALIPYTRLLRPHVMTLAAGFGRGQSDSRRSAGSRHALLAIQVACSAAMLVISGVLARSFLGMLSLHLDADPKQILTFRLDLSSAGYETSSARSQALRLVLDRMRAVPGVKTVGAISTLPFAGESDINGVFTETDATGPAFAQPMANFREVTPGALEALGVTVIDGRIPFNEAHHDQEGLQVVISKSTAERLWPDRTALGRRLKRSGQEEWSSVVGIVSDVRADLSRNAPLVIYGPARGRRSLYVVLRSHGGGATVAGPVRDVVRAAEPAAPVLGIRTLDEVVTEAGAPERFELGIIVALSFIALMIATFGIYSSAAEAAGRRRTECGIRKAVGGDDKSVLLTLAWHTLRPAIAGTIVGLAVGGGVARFVSATYVDLSVYDPVVYTAAGMSALSSALIGSIIPALGNTRAAPSALLSRR